MKFIHYLIISIVLVTNLTAEPTKLVELKSIGFSIEIPKDWNQTSSNEFLENLNRINYSSEALTKYVRENSEIPFYSIRKGDPESGDLLPTLNIKIQNSNLDFKNIPTAFRKFLSPLFFQLNNFDYIVEPKTVRINGQLAGFTLFSYSIFDENKNEIKVASAAWIFPQKETFYFIGTGFTYDNFEPILFEIKSIVNTVKINPK
ncbi:hypothetical protein JWG41_12170 [Leptospira sp. 201903075]|uniref:hypothetical protein n=1 Tax=Leptospira chreensis TaxID=2810035 RepID=UPI001962851C|nr:hypothetical protein [Leptospira chreensis]MBM9591209.1 hypothetical protein [Leptospira chreensis]